MTFQDIFKSGFLENMGSISLLDSAIAMGMAFLLGMYIFFIYKQTYSGVMYSSGFGVSLIAMTLITTLLIMAVVSNVVLSLGMVGALSIVRFRTAIKEPTDLMFLFWSIAIGIVLAAGLIPLEVSLSGFCCSFFPEAAKRIPLIFWWYTVPESRKHRCGNVLPQVRER